MIKIPRAMDKPREGDSVTMMGDTGPVTKTIVKVEVLRYFDQDRYHFDGEVRDMTDHKFKSISNLDDGSIKWIYS